MKWLYHWLCDFHSWRAVYNDGKKSVRMRWGSALNYASIFGGTIEFDPPKSHAEICRELDK